MELVNMDMAIKLHESFVCRLCAEINQNGTHIFQQNDNGVNLNDIINKYLPIKVRDDGKLPCTLCPGCTIQLEATRSFFDLIVNGQQKLQQLYDVEQSEEKIKFETMGKEQLESALKIVNPKSSVQTYTVQSDDSGEQIFIQILSDGPLFPPDHDLSLKLDNSERPKKKRGRPPKTPQSKEDLEKSMLANKEESVKETEPEPEEEILDVNGKPKRKIKKPSKYSDLIQGKELDRVFMEEGINDEEEPRSDTPGEISEIIPQNNMDYDHIIEEPSTVKHLPKQKQSKFNNKKFECEICHRTFQYQSRLDIHKAFHKDICYECTNCAQNFNTKEAFDKHSEESEHKEFKLIEYVDNYGQIELPHTVEKDITAIKNAEQNNPTIEKLKCDVCDKTFSSKQNLEIHHKAIHNNAKPYSCDKCDKQFPYLYSYKTHLLQHTEKTYPCDQCDKIFQHPSSLVYHRESEHNNGRKFVCNKCKKCFKHKQLLLRHQLVHTSERPHTCGTCSAAFKTRANLINHMLTHNKDKKFFCTECGLCFSYKTSLNLHQRWHNGQKPFKCDVCSKTFSQKGNLAEHRRIHTGEKPFCCSYCGRRFTTSSQYKMHIKRHTGERPWSCEYCSKTFLHKDTWKCHTRRHRNERPFQCSYCLRGFTEQWALRKHERLHTGEKPYTCDVCGKSFADSSNLKKHTKIHAKSQEGMQVAKKDDVPVRESSIEDTNNHVLYLTYNGSTDDQPALVQVVKGINESNSVPVTKDEPNSENNVFTDELLQGTSAEEISIDVQQLVDNEGNAISFTTDDGQQIKVVTTMDDEQCIHGLLPDGTLIPINLSTQDGKTVPEIMPSTQIESTPPLCSRTELNRILFSPGEPSLDDKNTIQFLNEGQNLCFITTYDIENKSIAENQFINLN